MNAKSDPVRGAIRDSAPGTGLATVPDASAELLRVVGASKSFGGVHALEDVSLSLALGQVLGVVGENGAGKSTLMKILGGVYPADTYEGEVFLRGESIAFRSVQDARHAGIVLIPQELHVAPELPIMENMFAGELPRRAGLVRKDELVEKAKTWLRFFELEVDPLQPAAVLSPSEQRLILIAGALSLEARVLILDEPTASLSEGEAQTLFRHVRRLRDQGIGILFISHRLDDIAEICDEVIVLRNGRKVAHFPDRNTPAARIVEAMIGRPASMLKERPPRLAPKSDVVLQVSGLSVYDPLDPERKRANEVSFAVRSGEILGIFGLVGSGRTEVLRSLFGTWPVPGDGEALLDGEPYAPKTPAEAIARRVGFLTEDRKQAGIFAGHSLLWNFDAATSGGVSRYGFFSSHRDSSRARDLMRRLDVRARGASQNIEELSGGNQQKVLLGRWLALNPRLLLLDEPTAGVDVGAREDIYKQIEELAAQGCAVLVVSSDLDEIIRLADRTHVMYKGRLVAEVDGRPTRHELMAPATGGTL